MANKKVSDKDYLFISSMLKARENRMLRRDRLEQMLSSGSFEEAARLLAEIGWPDLSGKGSAAVSEALAKRQRRSMRRSPASFRKRSWWASSG